MNTMERQRWERIRMKGHARFIRWNFLSWGVPMFAVQLLGPYFYALLLHRPYHGPAQIVPSRVWCLAFDLGLWVFGFGYLMGEFTWRKREKEYLDKNAS
jgi:hypothetical protein